MGFLGHLFMKIRLTEGCVCDAFLCDGNDFSDLDVNKKREIAIKLIEKADSDYLDYICRYLVEEVGSFTDLGRCEQCGDYIEQYDIEL